MTQALPTIIAAGESLTLELKKSKVEKDSASCRLCALANRLGGKVVFGVTPSGSAVDFAARKPRADGKQNRIGPAKGRRWEAIE